MRVESFNKWKRKRKEKKVRLGGNGSGPKVIQEPSKIIIPGQVMLSVQVELLSNGKVNVSSSTPNLDLVTAVLHQGLITLDATKQKGNEAMIKI